MAEFSKSAILEKLNWRYAVKQFDATKKISAEDWNFLAETLRLTPSSFGLQPWKFLLIQDPSTRTKLRAESWNQAQVEDCSHFVVLTTLRNIDQAYIHDYIEEVAKVRNVGVDTLAGYEKSMVDSLVHGRKPGTILEWSRRQVYIAMGNLLTAAALLDIDACPMEGLNSDAYDTLLGLQDSKFATVAAVPLGYRHKDDKLQHAKKVRFTHERLFEKR